MTALAPTAPIAAASPPRRRRWGAPVRALAIAAALLCAGCGPSPVTREAFERIEPGMTRAEVEAVLGKAHESYQGILTWRGDHSKRIITITLDDRGRVAEKTAEGL